MSFAFRNIILNQSPLSQSGGRLSIGGVPLAFLSEAAGGVTGLTVGSGDARYVGLTGDQTISGTKTFYNTVRVTSQTGAPDMFIAGASAAHPNNYLKVDSYDGFVYIFNSSFGPEPVFSSEDMTFTDGSTGNSRVSMSVSDRVLNGRWKYTGHTPYINFIMEHDDIVSYRNMTEYAYPTYNPSGYFSRSGTSVLYATYGSSYPSVDLDQGILYTNYYNTSGHSVDYNGLNLYNGKTGSERKLRANWDVGELYDSNEFQSIIWMDRQLTTSAGFSEVSLEWENRQLSGNWSTNTVPTATGHIVNKAYVDSVVGSSSGVFTLPFGHSVQTSISDSTSYYFGGCPDMALQTTAANSSVVVNPQSGVLRKVVGNANVAGTLTSSEIVNLIVYLNDSPIATGSYQMTGKNNTIISGLDAINRNISYLDRLYLATVTPAWTGANPTTIRQSAVAYISLG